MDESLRTEIRHASLQNAHKYGGKANEGAVLGAILGAHPELKSCVPDVRKEISAIVKEVAKLSADQLDKEVAKLPKPKSVEQPKEKALKPLPNATPGAVVTRFAPNPGGPLHIGRALVLGLNHLYAQMYDGKMYLRLEDTDPEKIYPAAYQLVPDDVNWLTGNRVAGVIIQSERLGHYYDACEKIIEMGEAYVCTCDEDEFNELKKKGIACPCRKNMVKENHARWDKMFGEYKPGEAVVRIKTNIEDPNPAMRDWPAIRINDHKHPHTGTEHRVWPLMNFSVLVDDHLMGVTHTIRGKDHMDNAKKQAILTEKLGWPAPTHLYFGRINFEGFDLSTTETRKQIEEGAYSGWDDIRLPTILAFRRRGYQPGSFLKLAKEIGASQTDKTVAKEDFFKSLNTFNRELIDGNANRYFFIRDPVKITVKDVENKIAKLHLHPDHHERGNREFAIGEEFTIEKTDSDKMTDGLHRLMDCLNFTKKGNTFTFHSFDYEYFKENGTHIMHWLPVKDKLMTVKILMPDGTTTSGQGEHAMTHLKVGDIVQLERFGFCRLDARKGNELSFWFTHQ